MLVPISWLADYVELAIPIDELAHRLTMAGLKIESVTRIGLDWQDVIVAQVREIEPHPKSRNPLWVTRVDTGSGEITVVTGAPNLKAGDKAPLVRVGGTIPHGPDGKPLLIEARPMAGITSEGMLASAREIGLGEDHSGILVLPPDAPVGEPLRHVLGDDVLDIETNPNRPDTLSIIGIAREVAAITGQQLTLPDLDAVSPVVESIGEESIPVEVRDPDLCPRYSALRIEGVRVQPSPAWLAERVERAGMRPINLIVDLTNYVMLEYGQPMHAFDATRLGGGRIIVRRARPGEALTTLDGERRELGPETLVIADTERAVAIAGVMGGEDSEIRDETTTLVLESATFDPTSVRKTAQALALRTDASARFEKGLPPEQTELGIKRFVQLLAQILDAPLRVSRVSDVWTGPIPPRRVTMPLRDLLRLLGLDVSRERAAEALSLLGFDVTMEDSALTVEVPFWRRVDIERSADLVEEVGRLIGYDEIPPTLPRGGMPPEAPSPLLQHEATVRDALLATGASEVVTHSLTSSPSMERLIRPDWNGRGEDPAGGWGDVVPNAAGVYGRDALTVPVRVSNPASRERQELRLTLLPSLLDVVSLNLKHTDERVGFFEITRTYFARHDELPYERRTLAIALSGNRTPPSWQQPAPGPYSLYDIKGILETLQGALRVEPWETCVRDHPALHPGRAAAIRVNGHDVAIFGELHPDVASRFGIESWPVQVAEIDLDTVFEHASSELVFRPLPRYPAALRDIAIVVDRGLEAGSVIRQIKEAGGDLLESARIFDVFEGGSIASGKKSIAVGLVFRAPGATLTQEQVNEAVAAIVERLSSELGAILRD